MSAERLSSSCFRFLIGLQVRADALALRAAWRRALPMGVADLRRLECGMSYVFVVVGNAQSAAAADDFVLSSTPSARVLDSSGHVEGSKSYAWFEAASAKSNADYIFKMDTDVAICPSAVHETLLRLAREGHTYIGGTAHTPSSACSRREVAKAFAKARVGWLCSSGGSSGGSSSGGSSSTRSLPQSRAPKQKWLYMSGGFYGLHRSLAAQVAASDWARVFMCALRRNESRSECGSGAEDLLLGASVHRLAPLTQANDFGCDINSVMAILTLTRNASGDALGNKLWCPIVHAWAGMKVAPGAKQRLPAANICHSDTIHARGKAKEV